MTTHLSRRRFLAAAAAAGTGVTAENLFSSSFLRADEPRSANEKLNLGVIGVANRGASNLAGVSSENIVVLCDIDKGSLAKGLVKHPKADTCDDFRRVFDRDDLDGVVISTPDHMHAIPLSIALKKKLPVYCEKPLTHSVYEARYIQNLAAKAGVATQMGNQIHSGNNYRRVVEIIKAGIIGPVHRVHVWQGGGVREGKRVKSSSPPTDVNYDQWIGPAPMRPFHESHFHFNWRYWWDFGGGQLADFGCHYMDLPFWALDLKYPKSVVGTGEKGHNGDNECPFKMRVDYEFEARGEQPAVHLTWYHGGWRPKGSDVYQKGSAVLFEGPNGRLLADYSSRRLFMEAGKEAQPVENTIPNSIGHHAEWIQAIKTGSPTGSPFSYATVLTQAVLLGNVSYRVGQKKLEWDAKKLKATNCPEADEFIQREYRKGWNLA